MADGQAPRDRPTCATARCTSASTRRSGRRDRARCRTRRRPSLDATRSTTTVGDDLLRLIFTACHPVLSTEARVALTLRLLGGLTTDEIARAFLVPEPTIAQRIVRAKRTLAEAQVPFEVPRARRARRAPGVGARGHLPRLQRGLLGHRRRRLDAPGAVRRGAAPRRASWPSSRRSEPEVHGLRGADGDPGVARRARASAPSGEPILLLDQDRARWDQLLIRRGLAALERAEALGRHAALGPYALQAAIAACHARARTAEETDWPRIVALYDALARRRAVAGRRAQPRGRGRRWRTARRPALAARRRAARRARAEELPPAAERARRPAAQARPPRRGARRVRARRRR